MKIRILIILSIFFTMSLAALSQNADDIIAKYAKASGQDNAPKTIKNWHIEGKISDVQRNSGIPIKMWYKMPDNVRIEMDIQGMKQIALQVGDAYYVNNPMAGESEPGKITDPNMSQQIQQQLSGLCELTSNVFESMQNQGFTFKYDSTLEMDGNKVLKISATKKDEGGQELVSNIYLDAISYDIYKMQTFIEIQGQKIDQSVIYKNLVKVNGVVMPKLFEIYMNGTLAQKIELSTVEANAAIPAGTFDVK